MECVGLAETGSNPALLFIVAAALLAGGLAIWLLARRRSRAALTIVAVLALLVGVSGAAGLVSAAPAFAADDCAMPAPAPAPVPPVPPAPPEPPAPVDGVVTANPIVLSAWAGECPVNAASCTFTVDVTTLGDVTTNPGASIDYATFATASAPDGYTFSYDPATSVLTVTVTATTPGAASSYTISDTTGEASNTAAIALPAITAAVDIAAAVTAAPVPIRSVGPTGVARTVTATVTLTDVGGLRPEGDLDVVVTWPSWLDGAVPTLTGTDWSVVSTAPTTATIRYTGLTAGGTTPSLVPPAMMTFTEIRPFAGPADAAINATLQPGAGGDTNATNDTANAPVSVIAPPDLVTTITLPDGVFTATGQPKTVVVTVSEINGTPTEGGAFELRFLKNPNAPVQPYNATLTTATPSGGSPMTVNNAAFTALSSNPVYWQFRLAPGTVIPANGSLSFAITVTSVGTAGWTSSLSTVIVQDTTWNYDGNAVNNSASVAVSLVLAPPVAGDAVLAPPPMDTTVPDQAAAAPGQEQTPPAAEAPTVPGPAIPAEEPEPQEPPTGTIPAAESPQVPAVVPDERVEDELP